ncbi:MAG: DNA mismatch repair protein MutS [Acidobacteria bacterium]|nr:DNA mismatch repair protein MutS [Acidobacteriota bacterium]
MQDAATPLMRQYQSVKAQVPNALLMFRLGDFYEMFYEDAVIAARDLEITLTSRNKERGDPVPMCGVPHHSVDGYIARLIQKGHRVAICDQVENPRFAKKIVKRELTRVITPGTATDSNLLRSHENNFLAAVVTANGRTGIAWVDISTGEFFTTETAAHETVGTLEALNVREVLTADDTAALPGVRTMAEAWQFGFDYADRILKEHFRLLSLDGCGLAGKKLATGAAGAILHYLRDTQRSALDHLDRPAYVERSGSMLLDTVTVRNLELVEPLFAGESRDVTLLSVIDQTATGMGGRLLRQRLLRPSMDAGEIEARLDSVAELHTRTIHRANIRKVLGSILDLERLLAKTTMGTATPRELLALARSIAQIPALRQAMQGLESARVAAILAGMDDLIEVRDTLLGALAEEPPVSLADGGVIRDGYDPALDELRDISRNSKQYIAAIEAREKNRTGIASLKVRFNNVFGYYIEISKSNLSLAPTDYERKQTLVNAERFTTPELKELESKILDAEEKMLAIERDIFNRLRTAAAAEATRIRATAGCIAEIDVTAALAETAAVRNFARPRFSADSSMRVLAGRHPVIERLAEREASRFIPNDLFLEASGKYVAIITGPNMGGKSTYLRQAALMLILAQMGSFVPAQEALLPLVDRVFTRIGAADNLARGRSTFMVEMTETAAILNTASRDSFIVLDEIGRGTATYDGLALAWAVAEYVHDRIGAKTLFATHYHELTALAGQLDGVCNLHVSVKDSGGQIIFLRRVEPGAADRSYGIEVARLAALPQSVISRAREVLALHEKSEEQVSGELTPKKQARRRAEPVQIQLFEPVGHQIAGRIRSLNLDELRPVDALKLLAELQEELNR